MSLTAKAPTATEKTDSSKAQTTPQTTENKTTEEQKILTSSVSSPSIGKIEHKKTTSHSDKSTLLSASGESSDERKKSEGKREDSKKRHSDQATTSQDKTKSTESGQKNGGNKTTGSQSTAEARDLSKSPPEGTVHRDNETKVERPEDIQTATGPTEGTSPRNTKPTKSEPPKKPPAAIPRPASAGFLMLSLDRSVRNLKEVPEDILDKFYLKKLTLYRNCLTALPSSA
jgi:hypothetical protein